MARATWGASSPGTWSPTTAGGPAAGQPQGCRSPGADTLVADLTELGARVRIAACDTGDREALARLLAGIPEDRPLTAVVHAAGVMDNALIGGLSEEQIDTVLRPKADTAWHLHELTRDQDLADSSCSRPRPGCWAAGQGNYAAANAFLDALAGTAATWGCRVSRWRGGSGRAEWAWRATWARRTVSACGAAAWTP